MTVTKGAYYKALFLLIVFSLNTVVSFACSFSSLFHGFHHHNNAATTAHKYSSNHHNNGEGKKHHHEGQSHHKQDSNSPEDSKDDCCSKNIIVLEKIEKAVSKTIEAPDAVFLTSFIKAYQSLFTLQSVENKTLFPDNLRWQLTATIQDLRIVIQSFQI